LFSYKLCFTEKTEGGTLKFLILTVLLSTPFNKLICQQKSGDALKSILSSAAEIQAQAGISKK